MVGLMDFVGDEQVHDVVFVALETLNTFSSKKLHTRSLHVFVCDT